MATRSHVALGALLGIVITVSGCAPSGGSPGSGPSSPAPSTSAPSATPTARPPVFRMPAACADIVTQTRLDQFEADGLTLLGGPDGLYGDDYLADPTPEQKAGGITCIWGDAATTVSAITISVAPLTQTTRPTVVASLSGQGLNANVEGPIATFAILGDADVRPSILNVLRADSWISVIMTVGGTGPFDEALDLADEVAATIYTAP